MIKVEQLVKSIERRFDERNVVGMVSKLVSAESIERMARSCRLARPATVDWAAKFGLSAAPRVDSPPVASHSPSDRQQPRPPAAACASCGRVVTEKVAAYTRDNADRFGGKVLCWDCQRRTRRPSTL